MNVSVEELQAEVGRLKALLIEADGMRRHVEASHLEACEKIDTMSRIISAILLNEEGQIFIPKGHFDSITDTLGFNMQTSQEGYLLSLNSKDVGR